MKFISFLFCLLLTLGLKAQNPTVPNEYMIYFKDGTTPAQVNAIANDMNSTVLHNLQPGNNIAVFHFNGTFPFPNPYNPTESINSLIEVVGNVKKHKPEGDGGGLNYYSGISHPGNSSSNCYNQNLLVGQTDDESRVSVAVFDTGTNWDLANLNGFNFGTAHEMFGDATDKHGHGTHVATIANQVYLNSNNGSSTINVDYVFGNPLGINGQGTLADMILSMERAIQHGANIINCSYSYWGDNLEFGVQGPGGPGTSGPHIGEEDPLYLLMSAADPTKTLFVVSAGNNNGFDLDGNSDLNVYPAAFPLENMITVASHSCLDELSSFSNLGDKSVDIAAPGEEILSVDHEMDWVIYSGTSQAAAQVSGAASVVATHLPVFDAAKVKCAIMESASYRPSLSGKMVTEGILDVPRAVLKINQECNPNLQRLSQTSNTEVTINPTIVTSDIDITFGLEEDGPIEITIYNLSGQLLQAINQPANKGSNKISVNLDDLPTNSYLLVRIETNEFTKTSKIIRIH